MNHGDAMCVIWRRGKPGCATAVCITVRPQVKVYGSKIIIVVAVVVILVIIVISGTSQNISRCGCSL